MYGEKDLVSTTNTSDIAASAIASSNARLVVVLAMHRTGSSVITRALSALGFSLGDNLLAPVEGENAKGFWEDIDIVEMNEKLLKRLGTSWERLHELKAERLIGSESQDLRISAANILRAKMSTRDYYAFKDPRTCLVLPFWQCIFDDLELDPHYIVTVRNPLEVASSLHLRNGFEVEKSVALWAKYTIRALADTNAKKRTFVSYDNMLNDPAGQLERIANSLGVQMPPADSVAVTEFVQEFLDARLRQNTISDGELERSSSVPDYVRTLYLKVRRMADDHTSQGTLGSTQYDWDDIVAKHTAGLPYLELIDRLEQKEADLGAQSAQVALRHERELSAHREELDRLAQESWARLSEIDALRSEYASRVAALQQEHDAAIQALRTEHETWASRTLQDQNNALQNLHDEWASREATLQQQHIQAKEALEMEHKRCESAMLAAHKAELSEVTSAHLKAELDAKSAYEFELGRLREDLASKVTQVESLQSEFESARNAHADEAASYQLEVNRLAAELANTSKAMDDEISALKIELSASHTRAEEIRRSFETSQLEVNRLAAELANTSKAMDDEISALKIELSASHTRAEEIRRSFETSTSWKITKGLRRIANSRYGAVLKAFRSAQNTGLLAAMFEKPNEASHVLINSFAATRPSTLFSSWHEGMYRRLSATAATDLPSLTISVVTHNSARWVAKYIASLTAQQYPLNLINLHFVDNESTDETVALLENQKSIVGNSFRSWTVSKRSNLGFGMGNDYAIRHSEDSLVLVSNIDVEFHATAIVNLVNAALSDDPEVASWEMKQHPYEHPKYYDPVTLETAWCSHACVLLKRERYIQIGGYEPRIFMYGEDVELSYRFRKAGLKLRYVPSAKIIHHVDLEDTALRPTQLSGSLGANLCLRRRYGTRIESIMGELALKRIIATEQDAIRRSSMLKALRMYKKNKRHFSVFNGFKLNNREFPFAGFDYHISRPGHDFRSDFGSDSLDRPLVTVVTRTHGPKVRYLSEAIASVLNQTYPNIEHIIVEDRTDFAEALVEKVKTSYGANIRYMRSMGGGRSLAGNMGLEEAKGEYLMLLDNDDLLFADHVELLVNEIVRRECRPNAAYSLAWELVTETLEDNDYKEISHNLPDGHRAPYSRSRLAEMNFIPIQSILFNQKLFEQFGGFDPELDYLEDWNLWYKYSRAGEFVMCPKVTSMYRTPADPNVRRSRQALLDSAYLNVRSKNAANL